MNELQDRLVRLGLGRLDQYGFVLAGGSALHAHDVVMRVSEDVDLFTNRWDPIEFDRALAALLATYRGNGLEVTVIQRGSTFARLQVTDLATGQVGSVDLAADHRNHEPSRLSVGPVLAEVDAVAAKVAAVFSRGYARDYVDLAGILDTKRYSRAHLMALAAEVDAGFDVQIFSQALAGVDRIPDEEFARYNLDASEIQAIRESMRDWSQALTDGPRTTGDEGE